MNILFDFYKNSNPRPSDYEKSVLTSCPERCAISRKSGNHRAATQLPQILQWRILWRAVYDLLAG